MFDLDRWLSIPTFILDLMYDPDDPDEKSSFESSLDNVLVSAFMKPKYNPKHCAAAMPQNIRLLEENKNLEEKK